MRFLGNDLLAVTTIRQIRPSIDNMRFSTDLRHLAQESFQKAIIARPKLLCEFLHKGTRLLANRCAKTDDLEHQLCSRSRKSWSTHRPRDAFEYATLHARQEGLWVLFMRLTSEHSSDPHDSLLPRRPIVFRLLPSEVGQHLSELGLEVSGTGDLHDQLAHRDRQEPAAERT